MQAVDLMTTSVITAGPEATVRDIARLLLEKNISAVPIVDDAGRVVGIVSEGDLMRRSDLGTETHRSWWLRLLGDDTLAADYIRSHGMRARDVMTAEVVTVSPEADIAEIAALLDRKHIKRVPVVDQGRLVGIVSRANLLRGLMAVPPQGPSSVDDQRIRADLIRELTDAGLEMHLIGVVVKDGVVRLTGTVGTVEQEHAIRVAIDNVPGIRDVELSVAMIPRSISQAY